MGAASPLAARLLHAARWAWRPRCGSDSSRGQGPQLAIGAQKVAAIPQLALGASAVAAVSQLAFGASTVAAVPQRALGALTVAAVLQIALGASTIAAKPRQALGASAGAAVPQLAIGASTIAAVLQLASRNSALAVVLQLAFGLEGHGGAPAGPSLRAGFAFGVPDPCRTGPGGEIICLVSAGSRGLGDLG